MEHCVSYVRVQYQVLSPGLALWVCRPWFLSFPSHFWCYFSIWKHPSFLNYCLLMHFCSAVSWPVHSTSSFWTACAFVRPHFKWHWHCCRQCQRTHVKFLVSIAESESISSGESCEMDEKSPYTHTAAVLICLPGVLSAECSWILQMLMGFPWEWRPTAI